MQERGLRKDAEERRQVILAKAARLFAEHGVQNVSMRQIAREAGVGQGTLYRSYTNKGELCWDLIGESCVQNYARMNDYLDEHKMRHSLKERLETVLLYHLESLETHSSVLAAIQASGGGEDQGGLPFYSEHYEAIYEVLVRLLKERQASHTSRLPDPIFHADAIMATLRPDVYIFLREHRQLSPEDIKLRLYQTFVEPLF